MELGFNFCFNVSINISYDVHFKYKHVYGLFPPFHKVPVNRFFFFSFEMSRYEVTMMTAKNVAIVWNFK